MLRVPSVILRGGEVGVFALVRWRSTLESREGAVKFHRRWTKETSRQFLDQMALDLGHTSLDDWYAVSPQSVSSAGGSRLLRLYPSFFAMLEDLYPEKTWDVFRRGQVPRHYWKNPQNVQKWFETLKASLNVEKAQDWNNIPEKSIRQFPGGASVLAHHGGKANFLASLYPDEMWCIDERLKVPHHYWESHENRRQFMEKLGRRLGITTLEDWRDVTHQQLQKNGAGSLLGRYESFFALLKSVYPEHDWRLYRKGRVPSGYWNSLSNVRDFVKYFEETHHLSDLEEWYRVSWIQIRLAGGGGLVPKYRRLVKLLSEVYPGHPWDASRLSRSNKRSEQKWLVTLVQKLYPETDVIEEYLYSTSERRSVEFDVFVPSQMIAFEFQGEHHFREIPSFGSLEMYQERDRTKRTFCAENRIILVEVPYTWDCSTETLQSLIHEKLTGCAQEMPPPSS